MKAIIEDRGRQYVVSDGQALVVDFMGQAEVGADVVFDRVLALGDTFGAPTVAGATVTAKVTEHGRSPKVVVRKFRRRKDYRRKRGHRQRFTRVTITGISS